MRELIFQVKNVKALVVDDNAVNLMVASNALMQYGIEVDKADSGSMAAEIYCENEYDFIFMDYLMPDVNGVETIRNIRNLNRSTKTVIIGLSADVSREVIDEFASVGVSHVMSKPLEMKELSEVLREHIPAEKMVKEEGTKEKLEQQGMAAAEEEQKSMLYKVKGLYVDRGLANVMGDMETYVKILNVCVTDVTEQTSYIKAASNLITASGLKIYFHSLKGILANIGADELSEFSKKMEIAAHDSDVAYIKENVASYIEQVENFRDRLKWALDECKKLDATDISEDYKPMDKKEFEEKLEQLFNHIRRFEFNEINDTIKELIMSSQAETREILKQAHGYVQQFQYDEALKLVDTLRK